MSAIPSNIAISSLQAAYQARQVADAQQSDHATSDQAALKQVQAASKAGETVGVADEDTAVFADSQGTGSEGRSTDEPADESPLEEGGADDASGLAAPPQGEEVHLDIQA
ncbi:MAG: hypothetical protein IT449_01515 [Phycisphaerales bacterium]|nr:hypothetical protein [Phycisphaerales bacterium]